MTSSELIHYGVKGMKWGVHKEEETFSRAPAKPMEVDPRVHNSTRDGAIETSRLMNDRYGYSLGAVKVLDKNHPHYEEGKNALAFVENNQKTGGSNDGTVFVQGRDMRRELKESADEGWTADGTGTVQGLITHESAHAMMHSNLTITTNSRGKQKVTGEHTKARDKAWAVAERVGRQDGYSVWDVSDYARTSMERGEIEAELFSTYHWGTNPPRFVQEWGKALHKEMGVDPTPFKEVKN
jgi:hypothetical protein